MNIPHTYTTAFGAVIDAEIQSAINAGMPVDRIASELGMRYVEVFNAACARRAMRESIEMIERNRK